jgi:hypothetical protein
MLILVLLLLIFFATPSFSQPGKESSTQIWRVGDRLWTVEEEIQYGKWVEETITEDFFIRHKIAIDCADVPYAVRWIYARIAHLPEGYTDFVEAVAKRIDPTDYDPGYISPHPEDSIEARWGLKKCELILSQLRSAQNSIDFIEKTYRKRDPRYADFSIRQQQEIIRRLIEEWNESQCKAPPSTPSSGKDLLP